MLFLPLPRMAEELFARERALVDALGLELLDDLGLRGDRRMVGSRHPAGVLALHPGAAHEHVLNRLVEHVPHVQHAGHVRRRDDHRIGLPLVGLRVEHVVPHPVVVPFRLDLLRSVFVVDFHGLSEMFSVYPRKNSKFIGHLQVRLGPCRDQPVFIRFPCLPV